MGKQPLVSICMITYDHEPFIAQAIEGVLGQQAEFEIELVIGDDVSTDATGRICREYQAKYPSTVRVLERSHNLGIALNFMTTLEACEGKYVAICEGDDYWTDPRKLQKQVDYMESRPALAVCHHRLQIRDEGKGRLLGITPDSKSVSSFADLAREQHIVTASCFFRNKLFKFPAEFLTVYGTDYFLNLLNAEHGDIGFIDEVMGTYRVHGGGAWSGDNSPERTEKTLKTVKLCSEYFFPKAAEEFEFHALKIESFLSFQRSDKTLFAAAYKKLVSKFRKFMTRSDVWALRARYLLCSLPGAQYAYSSLRASWNSLSERGRGSI